MSLRKHVSNLCMAEGSANTKVVLYCWAHHCQVLTSQGITEGITVPPNFQLFATNTAKAIYSRTNYFLTFSLISTYIIYVFVLVPRFRCIAALWTFPWLFGLQRVCKGKQCFIENAIFYLVR